MSKETLKLALEALQTLHDENMDYLTRNKLGGENNQCMVFAREAITALREALAKPDFWEGYVPEPVKPAQQEPFGYFRYDLRLDAWVQNRAGLTGTPFYTSPPAQRTWEEWFKWWRTSKVANSTEAEIDFADFMLIVRTVESEYGIKEQP